MDELNKLRKEIDLIDTEIMSLLSKRFNLSKQIGEVKSLSNIPILDNRREEHILSKTLDLSYSPQINKVYRTIMSVSKTLQND
jgi:monofunctional chorismate mutase